MPSVDFYYDIASPYSYLASTQIEAIASDCGAQVRWRPMLLGAVFKATGNTTPASLPARGKYMLTDLRRWAAYYGVPFQMPTRFPPNSLAAMRVLAGTDEPEIPELSHRLFAAYWTMGAAIEDPNVLAQIAGADAVARSKEQPAKDTLRATTDEAISRGVFGAPTWFVGDEMFFGNDRLPFVEQRLRAKK